MKKILTGRATISTSKRQIKGDWRKKMSDHVAWALIVYTGLHIFLTLGAIKSTGVRSLALFALVFLVAAIIPSCRKLERHWRNIDSDLCDSPVYQADFKRDIVRLWSIAIGLPFALTLMFKAMAALIY
mgnify:CR=1 FL=1